MGAAVFATILLLQNVGHVRQGRRMLRIRFLIRQPKFGAAMMAKGCASRRGVPFRYPVVFFEKAFPFRLAVVLESLQCIRAPCGGNAAVQMAIYNRPEVEWTMARNGMSSKDPVQAGTHQKGQGNVCRQRKSSIVHAILCTNVDGVARGGVSSSCHHSRVPLRLTSYLIL